MYRDAIESAYAYLIRPVGVVPGRDDLTLIGSVNFGAWKPELQHLTCFAGGMCVFVSSSLRQVNKLTTARDRLGLGAKLLDRPQDLETAINVTNACAWVYESSKTGIGGEQTLFYDKEDTARFVVLDSKGAFRPLQSAKVVCTYVEFPSLRRWIRKGVRLVRFHPRCLELTTCFLAAARFAALRLAFAPPTIGKSADPRRLKASSTCGA